MQERWTIQQAQPVTDSVYRLILVFVLAYIAEKGIGLLTGVSVMPLALHFGPDFHATQILTHFFLTLMPGLGSVLHVLFYCLMLWSFGSELERLWGSYHFLRFFLLGVAGGTVTAAVVSLLLPGFYVAGFGGGLAAVMVAYALIWPDRQVLFFFVIPMRMKWVILIILVMLALSGPDSNIVLMSGGSVTGALFVFYYARKGRLAQMGSYSAANAVSTRGPSLMERIQESLRKRRLRKKAKEIQLRIDMKDEVDRLLAKISKEGMKSLSRKEKSFLDKASKEF